MSVSKDKNITKEALLYNYKYLHEGAYREDATKDKKRMIRRSACCRRCSRDYLWLFFVKDGLLFRKDELRKEGKQWIVDKDNQLKVMRSYHDEKIG